MQDDQQAAMTGDMLALALLFSVVGVASLQPFLVAFQAVFCATESRLQQDL